MFWMCSDTFTDALGRWRVLFCRQATGSSHITDNRRSCCLQEAAINETLTTRSLFIFISSNCLLFSVTLTHKFDIWSVRRNGPEQESNSSKKRWEHRSNVAWANWANWANLANVNTTLLAVCFISDNDVFSLTLGENTLYYEV